MSNGPKRRLGVQLYSGTNLVIFQKFWTWLVLAQTLGWFIKIYPFSFTFSAT